MSSEGGTAGSYTLSLDEGTSSARALLVNRGSTIIRVGQHEFPQLFPRPGWVEHDPRAIWDAQRQAYTDALNSARIEPSQVAAIGITNQRETPPSSGTGPRGSRYTTPSSGSAGGPQTTPRN